MSRQYDRMVTICGPSEALSTELTVASIADCAKLCDSVQGCGAFDSNGASCFLKRHFAAANSSDLCALKGGWCGYRVVGPNVSLSDTVVVTQTHIVSPAATRRFLEAQRSIRQAGGRHFPAIPRLRRGARRRGERGYGHAHGCATAASVPRGAATRVSAPVLHLGDECQRLFCSSPRTSPRFAQCRCSWQRV